MLGFGYMSVNSLLSTSTIWEYDPVVCFSVNRVSLSTIVDSSSLPVLHQIVHQQNRPGNLTFESVHFAYPLDLSFFLALLIICTNRRDLT